MRGNLYCVKITIANIYFNSRLCMRGNCHPDIFQVLKKFQFTPLHERQHLNEWYYYECKDYFNSRLCMRGNLFFVIVIILRFCNFNSRLCMRGNARSVLTPSYQMLFQFTPLHERQPRSFPRFFKISIFQFTPLHERQRISISATISKILFQFTPLHERQHLWF